MPQNLVSILKAANEDVGLLGDTQRKHQND